MSGTKVPGAITGEMIMVHTAARREFGLMPELVRGVAEGDSRRVGLVADHIAMLGNLLHHHHSGEDKVIWPRLRDRCPAEVEPLVHTMEEQHDRIADLEGRLAAVVDAWRIDADADGRDAAAGILDRLVTVLREHLDAEEEFVLPLVESHITADEWDGMVAEGAADIRPEQMTLALGMTMYEGDPAAVRNALANIPAEMRGAVAEQAPAAYAAYARALYGTPTPHL
jgi:hemerythrin-like domain-containing protein